MNKEKALQVIKNVVDSSLKAGLFQNLETTVEVTNAFNFLIGLEDLREQKAAKASLPPGEDK